MVDQYCLWCGRSLRRGSSLFDLFDCRDVLCESCRQQMDLHPIDLNLSGLKVHSLYVYDGLARQMIIQYKESCDEALFPLFLWPQIGWLTKRYPGAVLVPMPSRAANRAKRGFDTVELLFSVLPLPQAQLLEKTDGPDQKDLHLRQRGMIRSMMRIKDGVRIPEGDLLLVDDIVTSGQTLLAARDLLAGPGRHIEALTVSYHRNFRRSLGKRSQSGGASL